MTSTWADGYGVWYASVPKHVYARPADVARRAIRRRLLASSSRSTGVGVRLHEERDGNLIYRAQAR